MTFDERVRALEPLRLTPRQTRFVATVALHGGYCLRRQYMAFAHLRYGKVVREFLDGLVTRGWATKAPCRADRGFLYHLHARSIYRALRQDDNRNRRQASLASIGRKLMLLDFVIAQPDAEWYATQDDKVQLFTTRFGVPLVDLPQQTFSAYDNRTAPTTRYFMDKLPIFLAGTPPVVHFVTLAIELTGTVFDRFLHEHARLFVRLPSWTVVVLSPAGASSADVCRRVFDHYAFRGSAGLLPDRRELLQHFTIRRAMEQNELGGVSIADLNHFRESRPRFAKPAVEAMYVQWLVTGERALNDVSASNRAPDIAGGRFVSHELPFTYEQFGDFAGVC